MSPEISDKTVKGNTPGNIINKANKETFDGEAGIRVVPCEFFRNYVEWEKRGQTSRKAPVNTYPASSDIMSKTKKPSRENEVVFKSYQDVINKNMKAGKDVTRLTKRLNTLLTKFRK